MKPADYILWQESLSVGSPVLDSQHRIILGVLNHLYRAAQTGQNAALLQELFETARRYTLAHFAYEEEQLERTAAPCLAARKAEYEQYRSQVDHLRSRLNSAPDQSSDELFHYLKAWWTSHIGKDEAIASLN